MHGDSSCFGYSTGYVFLRSVHTFSWFLKSNWSSDFGHAETGNGAKKRVVLRRDIYRSNFKVEWENGVWTKVAFSLVNSCSHAAISLWFFLFQFFESDFLYRFPNPFIVRSRPSFLFGQWKFFELYVRTCPAMFFASSNKKMFRFTPFCHFFNILREIFLTSLG